MNFKLETFQIPKDEEITQTQTKSSWWEVFFLILAPVVVYLILKPNLVNQAIGIDANLYAGYVHNFHDLIDRFGLTYYSVRFAAIWPHRLLTFLFEPWSAYIISRYLLALLATFPLYALVKQHFTRTPAILACIFLLTNPIYERALLWTYVDSFGITYTLAAICLLFFKSHDWRIIAVSGLLMGLAIHSTVYCSVLLATAIPAYLYYTYAKGFKRQLNSLFLLASGIIIITIIGCSIFAVRYGSWNIFEPTTQITHTLATMSNNVWLNKKEGWQFHTLPLYLPVIALSSIFLRNRKDSLSKLTISSLFFLLLFSSVTYGHGFVKQTAILDYFYYFSFFIVPTVLVVGSFFGEFLKSIPRNSSVIASACVCCVCFVLPIFFSKMTAHNSEYMFSSYGKTCIDPVITIIIIVALFLIGLRLSKKNTQAIISPVIITISLLLLTAPMTVYRLMFTATQYPNEEATYKTAVAFSQAFPPLRHGGSKLWFWYKNHNSPHLTAAQSTFLWGYSRLEGTSNSSDGMPQLTPECLEQLKKPDCNNVVLLGNTPKEIQSGITSLARTGISFREKSSKVIKSSTNPIYITSLEIITADKANISK